MAGFSFCEIGGGLAIHHYLFRVIHYTTLSVIASLVGPRAILLFTLFRARTATRDQRPELSEDVQDAQKKTEAGSKTTRGPDTKGAPEEIPPPRTSAMTSAACFLRARPLLGRLASYPRGRSCGGRGLSIMPTLISLALE